MRCSVHCPSGSSGLVVMVLGACGLLAAAVVWVVANLALAVAVLAVTAALSAAAYAAVRWASRTLLHALGGLVVPVGYRRLRPAAPAARVPLPALETRAPLAIEAPKPALPGWVVSALGDESGHHAPMRESES